MQAPVSTEAKSATAELRLEGGSSPGRLGFFRICGASARDCRIRTPNRGPGGESNCREGGYWVSAGGEARGTEWKSGGLCFLGIGQEGEGSGT